MVGTSRSVASIVLTGTLAFCAWGCASTHAKSSIETPPLDMPEPPPRTVEAADTEPPPPVGLVEEPARHATPTTLRRSPQTPPKQDSTKPEPPKAEAPPPPTGEPPKVAEEPPKPSTTLQIPPAGSEGEVERNIRAVLARATNDLNRIDLRALDGGARTQYDTAKGFVRQAEEALRAKNLVFAKSLAEKAAALAAQLAGR